MKTLPENLLEYDSINEHKAFIKTENIEETEDIFKSSHFIDQEVFLKNLLNTKDHVEPSLKTESEIPRKIALPQSEAVSTVSDSVILKGWKNIENISARLIESNDEQVILECLIDKENKIYEERIFRPSLFKGLNKNIGSLFYLRFYERSNELKMQIHDDPELTFKDDFPKLDYVQKFKNSRLFK